MLGKQKQGKRQSFPHERERVNILNVYVNELMVKGWGFSCILTLFLLRGAKSGPNDQIQCGIFTFWWLELPNFMTLFLFTFVRSQRGYFLKKENQFLKNQKKMISHFQHQRVPPLDKNQKSQNFSLFLKNNHTFLPKNMN